MKTDQAMIRNRILFLLLLSIAFGCEKEATNTNGTETNGPSETPTDTTVVASQGNYLKYDSDYLFDQEKLPAFYLELSDEALEKIDADPAAEEYVSGRLIFEGDTLDPVGIRYKGSIGAFVNCLSGNNWAEPSGRKICTKLSLKIKIIWEGRTDKFYGLKKLQFHSMNNDDSQLRERLGYWLFNEAGTPAPRAIHSRLFINGEYSGLYALVENIDGRFTRYNWEDGKGNLYKEVWPLDSNGEKATEADYLVALKTNEDENPSVDVIKCFGGELSRSSSADSTQSIIEKYMDVDEVLTYSVVDRMIRHDDGPFHWYCGGNTCTNHNYYWYEEPDNKQLHLIAWDLDNAFENISTRNIVTNIPDEWGETRNQCQPFAFGFFGLRQKSAACDKLIGGWASYTEEYAAIKEGFKAGAFSETRVNEQLDKWIEQIRAATQEANNLHGDAISINEWDRAVTTLKSQLAIARMQ